MSQASRSAWLVMKKGPADSHIDADFLSNLRKRNRQPNGRSSYENSEHQPRSAEICTQEAVSSPPAFFSVDAARHCRDRFLSTSQHVICQSHTAWRLEIADPFGDLDVERVLFVSVVSPFARPYLLGNGDILKTST